MNIFINQQGKICQNQDLNLTRLTDSLITPPHTPVSQVHAHVL
jgi:hypothetical protein